MALLEDVKRHGVGVLFISHTVPHVLQLCDRIVVLWQGRVAATLEAATATVDSVVREITGGTAGGISHP